MTIHIGIVMDDINNIKTVKDSSFAMMIAAQKKGGRESNRERLRVAKQ